jgi:hypothetical protein
LGQEEVIKRRPCIYYLLRFRLRHTHTHTHKVIFTIQSLLSATREFILYSSLTTSTDAYRTAHATGSHVQECPIFCDLLLTFQGNLGHMFSFPQAMPLTLHSDGSKASQIEKFRHSGMSSTDNNPPLLPLQRRFLQSGG